MQKYFLFKNFFLLPFFVLLFLQEIFLFLLGTNKNHFLVNNITNQAEQFFLIIQLLVTVWSMMGLCCIQMFTIQLLRIGKIGLV